MDDSFDYDTIKETNEEHSPDRDDHHPTRKPAQKLAPRYSGNAGKQKSS
jgi:hypothetical protein